LTRIRLRGDVRLPAPHAAEESSRGARDGPLFSSERIAAVPLTGLSFTRDRYDHEMERLFGRYLKGDGTAWEPPGRVLSYVM